MSLPDVSKRQVGDVWWYNGNRLKWDGEKWKNTYEKKEAVSPVPEEIDVHGPRNIPEAHAHQRVVPCHVSCPAYAFEQQENLRIKWINSEREKHGLPEIKKDDGVDHPKHYNSHPSGIECIEVVRHLNFNVGNAFKYLWRCGIKDGETEVKDLMKAIWYLKDEIERLRNTA